MRLIAPLLLLATFASAQPLSIRGGLGLDHTRGTTLADIDCSSTNPPALFGCVEGLAARGDFGHAELFELGVGYELTPQARVELMVARRNGLGLDARTNFPGVTGEQPVFADAESTAAFVTGAWAFGSSIDARPFVMAGAGVARNEIGAITFQFPGIAPDAVTIIRGGKNTDLAFIGGAGIEFSISDRLGLELALRYTNLGQIRTDSGPATIVRPRGTSVIDIAGTEADVETIGVLVSLRVR